MKKADRPSKKWCEVCRYFVPKPGEKYASRNVTLGGCHAHAPTEKGWPPVYRMDSCGDHKP